LVCLGAFNVLYPFDMSLMCLMGLMSCDVFEVLCVMSLMRLV